MATLYIAEFNELPITDNGIPDIAMTPPRTVALEKLPDFLRDELGLALVPFDGPFTASEGQYAGAPAGQSDKKGFALRVVLCQRPWLYGGQASIHG